MLRQALALVVLLVASFFAHGQPAKLPRVGALANTIPQHELDSGRSTHPAPRALVNGLRSLGWVDGVSYRLIWRSAEGDLTRLSALAEELLRENVDVLMAYGPGVDAAMQATDRVPIVMATSGVSGQVAIDGKTRIASLARPGGNITGLTLSGGDRLNGKRLALLKQAVPRAAQVGLMTDVVSGPNWLGAETRAAANALGLTLHAFAFGADASSLEAAFAEMARKQVDAVVVLDLPITNLPKTQTAIHRLAERYRLPVLHHVLSAPETGGLMAFGPDINRLYQRAPYFIDRILRGTKPGDIAIEQPRDFELRINLRAAKAIGLVVPQSLLLQADKVIE